MTSKPVPREIKTTDSKDYYIRASWEARQTPDELAGRFLRMIDALKEIDPSSAFGLAAEGDWWTSKKSGTATPRKSRGFSRTIGESRRRSMAIRSATSPATRRENVSLR